MFKNRCCKLLLSIVWRGEESGLKEKEKHKRDIGCLEPFLEAAPQVKTFLEAAPQVKTYLKAAPQVKTFLEAAPQVKSLSFDKNCHQMPKTLPFTFT